VSVTVNVLGMRRGLHAMRAELRVVAVRERMRGLVRGAVAPTDHDWYQFLLARPEVTEVNFWRPGSAGFGPLQPGEPFFFKLKAPHNAIGGFGLFARFARLPIWRAWDVFGQANGTADEYELLARLQRLGRVTNIAAGLNRVIGCIAVTEAVFFSPDEWVPAPADWSPTIMSVRGYDLDRGEGQRLWRACLERAAARRLAADWALDALDQEQTGRRVVIRPRLGQASFRLAVLEAYSQQRAVTTEHTLPVVDAAHIRPWAAGGAHEVPNGLPLRRDLHRLFDLGYVTVRPDLRFQVSSELRDDYANGRVYYELAGRQIQLPADPAAHPSPELLAWHESAVYRGH
jgi:putative restriction endonuclease